MTELSKNTQVPQCDKTAVSGSVFLQIGMRIKIKDNSDYGADRGLIKEIKCDLPDYNGKRAFGLGSADEIWIIDDFEYCTEYPDLPMR